MDESPDRAGSGRDVRVLLVDDEPGFAEMAAEFVERRDDRIAVETAGDGEEALARLDGDTACVVADYDMPGLNGIELLEEVRRDRPELPYILFTGRGSEEIASEAISAGVTDYLQKQSGTDHYDVLANRIRNVVDADRSRRALTERTRRLETLIDTLPGVVYRCRNEPAWPMETIEGDVESFTGHPPSAFLDGSVDFGEEVIHRDDRDDVWEAVQEGLETDGTFEVTYRIVTAEGETKWAWERGRGVHAGDDRLEALEGFVTDVTDRVERERELTEYETIVETARDIIYTLDPEGDFVMVNDYLLERTGYEREELVGAHVSELLSDEEVRKGARKIREMLANGGDPVAEYGSVIEGNGGESIPIRLRIAPLLDDDRFRGTVGIARDVTEQTERERELERYERLVETMAEAMYVLDEDGVITFVNDAFTELAGYDRSDLVGEHVSLLLDEREVDKGVRMIQRLLTSDDERIARYQQTLRTADGTPVECAVRQALLPLEDGAFSGTVGTLRDVSGDVERERVLTALNDIAGDLAGYDSVEAICERTIRASQNVLEFDLSVIDVEEDGYLRKAAISADIPTEETTTMSVEEGVAGMTYRSGESMLIEDVAEVEEANPQGPFRSAISIPIGDHGVFQAVAEEPGAFDDNDLELAELLVSHATNALDRLEGERQLRRQNERLERFAGIVSHDLRGPLNVARGRMELLGDEFPDEHVSPVVNALDRMEAIVENTLTLARQGRVVDEPEPIALPTLVERCWRGVVETDATLQVPDGGEIRGDPHRVRTVFENLFRNAVEHAGEDATVRVGILEDGFAVEDDGSGIPEDQRQRVFEVGHTSGDGGTGFGLAIVAEIAEAHGWEVSVTEGRWGGARFEFRGVEFVR